MDRWTRHDRPLTLLLIALFSIVALQAAVAAGVAGEKGTAYRIGPRDKVYIHVAELAEFNREFEVDDDGTLQLPVIDQIEATGLTEEALAEAIRGRLEAEGLRRATVSVRITAFRSRPVAVLGAVQTPGNQYIPGRATLLEVLLAAGGLRKEHDELIQVRRRASNGLTDQIAISSRDLVELGDPAVNLPIFAGDVILVPEVRPILINFLGQVSGPGTVKFDSNERPTLLVAISRAGGLGKDASPKIRILRRRDGKETEITANYRRILAGKDPDVVLEDGDIVVVKESFF